MVRRRIQGSGYAGRTPLFAALRRVFRLAQQSNHPKAPPLDEYLDMHSASRQAWGRRDFLRATTGAAALGLGGAWLTACSKQGPRIAIVGGGMAGLNAAYILKKSGILANVYEAGKRLGGRIYTATDVLGPGLYSELGGEFIDSGHEDVLGLAKEFGLQLLDRHGPGEAELRAGYFFGGRHYTPRQIISEFKPLARRINVDAKSIGEGVSADSANAAGKRLDRMSVAHYLEHIGARGWVRDLLQTAYVVEFGLDADQQSALNLITLIGTELTSGKFEVFGESDERFKIKGGNELLISNLAQHLTDQIHLENKLEAIDGSRGAYTLTFQTPAGIKDIKADMVLTTLPFNLLREVKITVDLPEWKKTAISQLGYGTNSKLLLGMSQRVWRKQTYSGELFTDEPLQSSWDSFQIQDGKAGGLTLFLGGRAGVEVGHDTPEQQANRLIVGAERAFPGVRNAYTGKVARFHWPSYPLARCSYACYKPGQWSSIAGNEFKPVDQLYFAGEHTSTDFQGYMNGAAETGRRAAQAMLAVLA